MSDISGEGHGSSHNWEAVRTTRYKVTFYRCRDCSHVFQHAYGDVPDIFMAMKFAAVPLECSPTTDRGDSNA